MANRTGTYFAFDGQGQADPTKSDFRYYATVQGWNASKGIEFKFVNSHDKAGAVRDTSKLETLKASIRQRLSGLVTVWFRILEWNISHQGELSWRRNTQKNLNKKQYALH